MEGEIPIKIISVKKPNKWTQACLSVLIIFMLLIILGMSFVWWQGQKFWGDFSAAARHATQFANQWDPSTNK